MPDIASEDLLIPIWESHPFQNPCSSARKEFRPALPPKGSQPLPTQPSMETFTGTNRLHRHRRSLVHLQVRQHHGQSE
eukprot:3649089-Amphidinium_carterae.1